ncbi:hypothetical protein ACHAWT_003619 [Skeletonema menzelii]
MMESNFNIPLPDDVDLFREFTPSPSSFEPDVGGSNPDSFPTVLHGIVSDESSDDCIHWLPSGTHFAITDKEKFSKKIIPLYFGSRGATKFTSFTRRLKRWKFTRISKGPQLGAYYHENFVKDKPELLEKIVYPGARPKSSASPQPKSASKVKSANKARRRASTGCLSRPPDGCLSRPIIDPFDIALGSISAPTQEYNEGDVLDNMNISPMPIKRTLNLSFEPPMLTKDFTNWLSDTTFGDDDQKRQSVHGLPSPPTGPASVVSNVSNSSQLPLPQTSKSELSPVTSRAQKAKPFRLVSRRHSIASIHSTSSYNVPLNDVGSMPIAPLSRESTSSYNRIVTDDNLLTSTEITRNGPSTVPEMLKQQMHQQPLQNFVAGSPSQVGASVHQRLQQLQLQQLQLQQVQQQQVQQQQVQQLQHFVGESSSHVEPTADLKQQQQPQRSSFHDELDDLFRFSREFTVDDFLSDIR